CAGFDTSHEPRPGALERLSRLVVRGDFSRPQNLRPCCAFGHSLGVELAELPVPGIEVQNVIAADDPGSHTYDGGLVSLRNSAQRAFLNAEKNGLVFTCRGGFIDLAHVRDYADWTAFLALRLDALLHRGTLIDLGDEAGTRLVYVEAIDPETIATLGRRRIAIEPAGWLAYQASIWHEVATWYGYAAIDLFPERASAFSPEDLYSNLLGVKVTSAVVYERNGKSERLFNQNVDIWIAELVGALRPVSKSLGREAAYRLDGLWWDSSARLPDMDVVLRRNLDMGESLAPWLVPADRTTPALDSACEGSEPARLSNPSRLGRVSFPEIARIEIEVPDAWADQEPFRGLGPRITQADFPALVSFVRGGVLERYGPRGDRPD
ncbi:MAG: DUF4056 domain-containing protein, partial [Myxococcota bacterium]|nr:DUF4056 domain-containing protein [Myxococcota bacterium]